MKIQHSLEAESKFQTSDLQFSSGQLQTTTETLIPLEKYKVTLINTTFINYK